MPRRPRDEVELAARKRARETREAVMDLSKFQSDYFKGTILQCFAEHADNLRTSARQRREAVQLRNVVADREMQEAVSVEDTLGKRQPGDEYQGDVNMRTLRTLLSIVDQRGFERSALCVQYGPVCQFSYVRVWLTGPHQMKFHSAFERAAARVVYRSDWETQRPAIMRKNNWKTCPGEVMIRCTVPAL